MSEWLWLPPDLVFSEAVLLIAVAGLASLMTAVLGIGGGLLMLAVMAQVVPVAALIPAHGIVQLGSNGNRAFMIRQHIDWPTVAVFVIGALIGAVAASFIVVQLPLVIIELTVGAFILFMVWGPKPAHHVMTRGKIALVGVFSTILTMFVGATGPLVAASIHRKGYEKLQAVATFSSCMTVQNTLKIAVFSFVGFQFLEWLPLLGTMIVAGGVGTWIGLHVLHKMSGERFKTIFRLTITLLALRLLWQAISRDEIACGLLGFCV